jgi:hypothetical protein
MAGAFCKAWRLLGYPHVTRAIELFWCPTPLHQSLKAFKASRLARGFDGASLESLNTFRL